MDHRFLRIIKANICLLPGIILLAACVLHVKASGVEELKNIWYETRYYPIYQDGPEWQKHSMEDTFEINNPPYDLLFSMSSDELADLLFESPYLTQLLTYYGEDGCNEYTTFFAFMEHHSEIFYELLRREDGITAILDRYRSSGVDASWLNNTANTDTTKGMYRWWAEIFGSQFMHEYSDVFTEEETDLARLILSEKNSIYDASSGSPLSDGSYFDVSDIEYRTGNTAGMIRAKFLSEDEISEKEKTFIEAAAVTETEEEPEEPASGPEETVSEPAGGEAGGPGDGHIIIYVISGASVLAGFACIVIYIRRRKGIK
ncbi:MAG: hypothetical protein J6W85_02510 [Lachnospiraceae bacterium]|nr:hypothetical protein [Lachnospiraceae bacterium]